MIIRSRAPVRITFGGGGTDISPYDKEYTGICLGATINRYVYTSLISPKKGITINSWDLNSKSHFKNISGLFYDGNCDLIKAVIKKMNPKKGLELYVRSDAGPHSGLGASASACASMIGVFNHLRIKNRLTKYQISELAYNIEQNELENVGGRQDQYAAVFGGINLYEFHGDNKVFVNPLDIKKDYILELEKNLLLVYVGERTKSSGAIHKEEEKKGIDVARLHDLKQIAIDMEYALRKGNLDDFGTLIKKSWDNKILFNSQITNPHIDNLIRTCLENGAIGARLMGAGGGGHILVYCKPNKEQIVSQKLIKKGAKIIPFSFDFTGLQTWEVEG